MKQYAVPLSLPGNTRHFELGRRLKTRGQDVTIISSSFNYGQQRQLRVTTKRPWLVEEVDGVRFVWIKTPAFACDDWRRIFHMLVFAFRTWQIGRGLTRRGARLTAPDVVIGCTVPPTAAIAGYLLARRFRCHFCYEIGDVWPQALIDAGFLSERHPLTAALSWVERFLIRKAQLILTPLPGGRQYVLERGGQGEKVVWIRNGAALEAWPCSDRRETNSGGFTVVYAGIHARVTPLETLLHAAKILQDGGHSEIRFELVGNGPRKAALERLARSLRLVNVRFQASVPREAIPEILASASAAFYTLRDARAVHKYGVAGKKLSEYFAASLPVIFAAKSIVNPVEEAKCGITVPPEDPVALAEAITALYEMPERERERMGERGRRYAEEHYGWDQIADRLCDSLLELLSAEEARR